MVIKMKKIKIGIFGLGRGMSFAKSIMLCNGEVVAICDKKPEKIDEAKKLLRDTDQTMEQIAEHIGFGSAVHFSRTFRKKLGISPSEYRGQ